MRRGCALVLILGLACGVADAHDVATSFHKPKSQQTTIGNVICFAHETRNFLRVVDECIQKSGTYKILWLEVSLPCYCPRLIQATADLNSCCEKCLRHILPPRVHRLVEMISHVQNTMRFVRKRVLQVLKIVEFFIVCMKAIKHAFKQHRV